MRRSFEVELRESGEHLHGVMVQEGRAASGGRRELFAPGSVQWPSTGVSVLTEHRGNAEALAHPVREVDGRILLRTRATDAIRRAIDTGKRYMSVEFRAVEERTTAGGVREILRAFVPAVALVASPEYDTTSAEVRSKQRRRVWL